MGERRQGPPGRSTAASLDRQNSFAAETADISEFLFGYPMTGAFGYSHLTGGYAGGQAEFVRVPYSDVGPIVIPDGIEDEKVLFLSDIPPTGWMAPVNCEIGPKETVAVWGCGPMGAEVINFEEVNVREALVEMTGGIGPDACIDAVGMESHGVTADSILDRVKSTVGLVTDRTAGSTPRF